MDGIRERAVLVVVVVFVCIISLFHVGFAAPYPSYVYDFWHQPVPAPDAYLPVRAVSGRDLGIGDFSDAQDLAVGRDGTIYIADTGNNRLVLLDASFSLVRVISEFDRDGAPDRLSAPSGIFVTGDGEVYVADTNNRRLVVFDEQGQFAREYGPPESTVENVLPDGFVYRPVKVAVNSLGQIYVISRNTYEGLIELDQSGAFRGFMGAPRVVPSAADLFWRRFSTEAQKERQALFLPTEYSNLTIDHESFILATVSNRSDEPPIRRLNPAGDDILRRIPNHEPIGDHAYPESGATIVGPSILVDVSSHKSGIYSVLDQKRGRVFTYGRSGHLLYVFGGKGEREGLFRNPVALDYLGHDILVLDSATGKITAFEPTEYSRRIMAALVLYDRGLYDESTEQWYRVLALNPNYEQAYRGIGRSLLMQGKYQEAMRCLRFGQDRIEYSRAFRIYRQELITRLFPLILTVVIILIAILYALGRAGILSRIWDRLAYDRMTGHLSELQALVYEIDSRSNEPERPSKPSTSQFLSWLKRLVGDLRFPLYLVVHPFQAFSVIKKLRSRLMPVAVIQLLILAVTYLFYRQYTGFIFNTVNVQEMSVSMDMASILVPILLWCCVNWALTTLMDGKGDIKDIFMATVFGLTPIILLLFPVTILSNFMTEEEGLFRTVVIAISLLWSGVLVLVGTMIIHEYDLKAGALSAAASIAGMGAVMFVALLFFDVLDQVIGFVRDIYKEVVLRL